MNWNETPAVPRATPPREVRYVVHLMLFVAIYLAYLTLRSFIHPFIFAAVLASLCQPLNNFFERHFPGRPNFSATCVVLAVAAGLVVPGLLFLVALAAEGVNSMNRIQAWLLSGGLDALLVSRRVTLLTTWVHERLPFAADFNLDQQLLVYSKRAGEALLSQGAALAANLINLGTYFLLMLVVLFYLVRDGRQLVLAVKALTPLQEVQDERIVTRIRRTARSVFIGSFLTAVCQGVAGGIGLALVGIPALFWGSVMGVMSLVPIVGTALVWGPAVIYLAFTGHWGSAVFLFVWSVVIVGLLDNLLRPYLMRGGTELSPLFIFLAVLGGLEYFGLPGLLYGPLIITFTASVLYLYKEEFPTSLRG